MSVEPSAPWPRVDRHDRDPLRADMRSAILPVDILVDPDAIAGPGWLAARLSDTVRPERINAGVSWLVAGWGGRAWRTRLRIQDGRMEVMSAPRRIADDPSREPTDEWIRQARLAIAEVLPGLVDDATRDALIARMLQLPRQERAEMVRSARRLVGGYNTLRWSARRVLLQAVAEERLGRQRKPSRSPTWQVLARLTRTPARRLTGDVGRGVLLHDALPQCPTARAWVDE